MRLLLASLSILILSLTLLATEPPQAPPLDLPVQAPTLSYFSPEKILQAPKAAEWLSPEPMPEGAVQFDSATDTQAIYVYNDGVTRWNMIDRFPISKLEEKWRVSGGMVGISGWKSDKYRTLPEGKTVRTWTKYIEVNTGTGSTQLNKAIVREYPDGTRFDDILSNFLVVFEHRVRTKQDGAWKSEVIYEDKTARPFGYSGLRVSCASCHATAPGTGKYGEGLVPGGDGTFSDALAWDEVWVVK